MKIIDARTGKHVRPGVPVVLRSRMILDGTTEDLGTIDESYVLEWRGRPGLLSIPVRLRHLPTGRSQILDLKIRYLHPGFPFQRVAFVET